MSLAHVAAAALDAVVLALAALLIGVPFVILVIVPLV